MMKGKNMFMLKNLVLVAYAGSFSLFSYKTTDKTSEVLKTGYLTSSHIRAGDAVLVFCSDKTVLCEVLKKGDRLRLNVISGGAETSGAAEASGISFECQPAVADLEFKEIAEGAPLAAEVNERLKALTDKVNNTLAVLRAVGCVKKK